MVMNLGTAVIVFWITIICVILLLILARFIVKANLFKRVFDHFYQSFVYNSVIRFLIEAYLELTLTAFVNVQNTLWVFVGDTMAALCSYIFVAVSLIQPAVLYKFIKKYRPMFKDPSF